MEQQRAERVDYDSTGFIMFLYRWRRVILAAAAIALLGSVIFSSPWFIPPKYKSTVVMFPVSSNSISKALLSENFGGKTDILEFGEEEQAEQMLQILSSNKIRESVIRTFGLMTHYGIDTSSRYRHTRLYKEYDRNISFRRTEFMAVEISVLDTDPQMAADIANEIAALLDSTKNEMQRQRAEKAFRIVEAEYLSLRAQVQEMEDSLTFLRQMGVHDYESQSEMINQQLAIEIARGNTAGIRALEGKLDMLARYGGPYVSLRDALEHEKKQLSLIKAKYEEAKVDAQQELPQKFLVNTAYKAEKKSYPIRWLIVSVTVLLTFILTIFALVMLDNLRHVPWKKKRGTQHLSAYFSENPPERKEGSPRQSSPLDHRVAETWSPPPRSGPQPRDEQEIAANQRTEETQEQQQQNAIPRRPEIKANAGMTNPTDNMHLLQVLVRWRRHLAVIGVIAAVLAMLVSSPLVIKPRYKSFATLYPSNIWPYSDESESEQMLQLLNSTEVRDSVVRKFDLGAHYGLDPADKYYQSALYYMYSRYVNIRKTEFEAVQIEVMDTDPLIASEMVSYLISSYNRMVNALHHEKFREVMDNYDLVLVTKKAHIDSLRKRLFELNSQYGLLDYQSQSREITEGYLGTLDGPGGRVNMQAVLSMKKNMEEKGAELLMLQEMIRAEADGYAEFKLDYDQAMLDVNRKYTHASVISPPYPADKKAYPVRW
ncbi:MAG TPA: hypothetical protein P5550_03670, partial [Bacteroidales bacterium]|nr:hypothetical protein [Bacteroidales bacterium]